MKFDELTKEAEMMRQEIFSLNMFMDKLLSRVSDLEEELKKLCETNENKPELAEDEADVPMAQRKRSTQVKMARVSLDRNQYKERFMEHHQILARIREMTRESRNNTSLAKNNKQSVWKFYNNLYSSCNRNTLNIVEDDLRMKRHELPKEVEMLHEEIFSLNLSMDKLRDRVSDLEEELKKLCEANENKPESLEQVKMARVPMERNQYEDRFMKHQEVVREREMIRASSNNPTLDKNNKQSVWKFSNNLYSSCNRNALNVVKDDLIVNDDELTGEVEMVREEIFSLNMSMDKLHGRVSDLEEELQKKLCEANENNPESLEHEAEAPQRFGLVPMGLKNRFTQVKMARVPMERNQYKDRFMEHQEVNSWREMIRASRNNSPVDKTNKQSSNRNALNVVNDDLIVKVDELTGEVEMLREEIFSLNMSRDKLRSRVSDLEEELKKLREANENKPESAEDEADVPMAQRKRFTRLEMARVLMERNQYKEMIREFLTTRL